MTMRHKAATFLVLGFLISLCLTTFLGVKDAYDFTEAGTKDGANVFQKLNNLNLIEGINKITAAFMNIVAPSNILDLIGGLAQAGIGLLQTVGGIVTFPLDIIGVISEFYPIGIPGIFSIFIGAMVVLYVGFEILSAMTRTDL